MSKLTKALTAAAGNAGGDNLYVEDVFSTYLYTGDGNSQTITNGIDLSGEGGMLWWKRRDSNSAHFLTDSERGITKHLQSQATSADYTDTTFYSSFNSDGFTMDTGLRSLQIAGAAIWTFRKAEKFFDVVTYTGDGVAGREIAHSLGDTPGMIIIKATNSSQNWVVWHNSLSASNKELYLNLTLSEQTGAAFNSTAPTSSVFTVGNNALCNLSGLNYVAYLFASDAGGFGDDGSESIIKCGTYTGTGTVDTLSIELGFEPQWIMVKSSTTAQGWYIQDIMRGMPVGSNGKTLSPDTSAAESTNKRWFYPTATGVRAYDNEIEYNQSGQKYIYIAIRRPMKTPESGTEVFNTIERAGTGAAATVTGVGFTPDMLFGMAATVTAGNRLINDRMRGVGKQLLLNRTNTEANAATGYDYTSIDMDGFKVGLDQYGTVNYSGASIVNYCFKRATGFFDVVAWSGTDLGTRVLDHNLGVQPELIIAKIRNGNNNWVVQTIDSVEDQILKLNTSDAYVATSSYLSYPTQNTSTTFKVRYFLNQTGNTFIAYLFATIAGVSKIGSYTGTGSNVDVDCGFSAGARFILIKRTDSSGSWYVWDSERGIVAGNDPYVLLNSTAAGTTATDYIDPLSSGFTVTSSASAELNASGGNYIFLAIA